MSEETKQDETKELSLTQKEKIEENRLRALALRRSRIRYKPYQRQDEKQFATSQATGTVEDSHAGFILPVNDYDEETDFVQSRVTQEDPPALGDELITCQECGNKFAESFLLSSFNLSVCNMCRDPDGKHSLLTKTEAKEKYLLKECDFQGHGGLPLKFLLKKNPRGFHGDMKLFLLSQVEERAKFVWNGEEGLEKEKKRRLEAREKKKEKSYAKQLKDLRSTVYACSVANSSSHVHQYGAEVHNPSTDSWTKSCLQCGHTVTFEKM